MKARTASSAMCGCTGDGHLVCVHDRRIDRTSTGTGLVSEMSLAELREFDWGTWHSSGRAKCAWVDRARRFMNSSSGAGMNGGQVVHRDKTSGALWRARGKQGARALVLVHLRRRRPISLAPWWIVLGRRGLALRALYHCCPLFCSARLRVTSVAAPRRRSVRQRWAPLSRHCGSTLNSSIEPRPRGGRCTAGLSTTTTSTSEIVLSGARRCMGGHKSPRSYQLLAADPPKRAAGDAPG